MDSRSITSIDTMVVIILVRLAISRLQSYLNPTCFFDSESYKHHMLALRSNLNFYYLESLRGCLCLSLWRLSFSALLEALCGGKEAL